jgi:hypothetical protein
MCEHCRKTNKKENVFMTYSYYRKEEGESESASRVSPSMNRDEFCSCLSQMILSMKIHAENIYHMPPEEFRAIIEDVQGNFRDSFGVTNQETAVVKEQTIYN